MCRTGRLQDVPSLGRVGSAHGNTHPSLVPCCRGLVNWTQEQIAQETKVGLSTLCNSDAGKSMPVVNNLGAMQAALEDAGVQFIPENGGGAGLRLHDRQG